MLNVLARERSASIHFDSATLKPSSADSTNSRCVCASLASVASDRACNKANVSINSRSAANSLPPRMADLPTTASKPFNRAAASSRDNVFALVPTAEQCKSPPATPQRNSISRVTTAHPKALALPKERADASPKRPRHVKDHFHNFAPQRVAAVATRPANALVLAAGLRPAPAPPLPFTPHAPTRFPAANPSRNTTTDDHGNSLTYDAWNRLVEYTDGGSITVTYSYDALNGRITQTHPLPTLPHFSKQRKRIPISKGCPFLIDVYTYVHFYRTYRTPSSQNLCHLRHLWTKLPGLSMRSAAILPV